jgi:hypothetical protein
MVKQAHVNILPTFQATGIKLKLLAALYNGRYCIVNTPMIKDTGLSELCIVRDTPVTMKKELIETFSKTFDNKEILKRENALTFNGFSNSYNVNKLVKLLFP